MATSAEIRQQLVTALRSDLIGPGWDDRGRRHEQLSQPPSVWYTTGFLVPHVFQQEADRTGDEGQASYADLAGEDESNDAANRLEKKERDEDANDSLDQGNKRRSWFPSSLGMSFILERDPPSRPPSPGAITTHQLMVTTPTLARSPQKAEQSFTIAGQVPATTSL